MTIARLEVRTYNPSVLGTLLNELSHKQALDATTKPHLSYLQDYLRDIGARTIVVETPYTDRDYLEDYAAYYARCHEQYGRRCSRLHFFSSSFDQALIDRAIVGDKTCVSQLQGNYLGFIVVKPLPSTVIGRTCLVTYARLEGSREYPATREYKVHLFGIELSVRSLPFQEQDRDVAACATSALWSVFNETGHIFQHNIPSPAEITNAAAESRRVMSRALPAGSGLTAEQIADAIRSVGLEPGYIKAENIDLLLISATAYLRAGIPGILLGALIRQKNKRSRPVELGLHAVALAGYGRPEGKPVQYGSTLFSATGSTRLYAHDDQLGPFSKLIVDRNKFPGLLSSSASERTGIRFSPQTLLVPLYHKIRVPVEAVISAIAALNGFVEATRQAIVVPLDKPVVWDIQLVSNADLKREVYGNGAILGEFRRKALLEDLPRYMWRASAEVGGSRLFDLLFDATDLLQGGHFTTGIPYSKETCMKIASLARVPRGILSRSSNRVMAMALNWFTENANGFDKATPASH
ncbi:hypothetical protein [Bradyrhizobium sp.]|uniref:hypothetical protein n=1 Tax=Bradyrhizobium sp. TaxID=376 RepID=UPI00359F74AA